MKKSRNYYRDKTILITGAASGIGRMFAEKVSQMAPVNLILWDRNPDLLKELKSELPESATVYTTGIDISDKIRIQYEAEHVIKEGRVPDVVINCAGIVIGKMYHEHTPDEIEDTIRINTLGSMWVVHAFLSEMIERKSGHVVNVASASGYIGNPRMSVYASSKWAVLGWTDSLRLEMEKLNTGVNVTSVIPSYIKTGMFDGVKAPLLVPLLETEDIVDRMLKGIAVRKREIKAPFMVRTVPLLKALLPYKAFDWLAGSLLGVYGSMDSFKGRKPRSS